MERRVQNERVEDKMRKLKWWIVGAALIAWSPGARAQQPCQPGTAGCPPTPQVQSGLTTLPGSEPNSSTPMSFSAKWKRCAAALPKWSNASSIAA